MTKNSYDVSITRKSHSIGTYDLVLENNFFKCRVYWARVVGSETESLFTRYTKHTFYELEYALEGRIVMLIDGNTQAVIEQSEFVVIPPDTYHQIIDGDSVGARFIMAFSLEIKDSTLEGLKKCLAMPTPYRESVHMRRLLSLIVAKDYHDDLLNGRLITSYLECFMLEFIETVLPYRPQNDVAVERHGENEARVAEICRYIADYNGIGMSVEGIAKKFNISPRHLNRIFNDVCGMSPREVVNHQKLRKIEELVAATSLSFCEISELCGFSDEYAMNKFFKRYALCNLTEYRALRETKPCDN